MQNQLGATQQQIVLAKQAQRPWLGLATTVNKAQGPTIRFFNPQFVNYSLEGIFMVKNFGSSPAFDQSTQINLEFHMEIL
jgi:hypothetical protein